VLPQPPSKIKEYLPLHELPVAGDTHLKSLQLKFNLEELVTYLQHSISSSLYRVSVYRQSYSQLQTNPQSLDSIACISQQLDKCSRGPKVKPFHDFELNGSASVGGM
jgi:hypothetical protein